MKILIVDDSKTMRMLVKRGLRQAGFTSCEVVEAECGADAIASIEKQKPDVVLCDWNMPGMTGLELLQQLRSQGFQSTFGFVTSEGTPEMRSLAEKAGAQFYVAKPFTHEDLRRELGRFVA